jgi:hypothetical protein
MYGRSFVGRRLQPVAGPHGYPRLPTPNTLAVSKFSLESYMGNADTDDNRPDAIDPSGENKLRGNALDGSEQKRAPDHTAYEKKRNPDAVVRLDGEEDPLYDDGLDVDESAPALIITPGEDSTR